MALEFLPAQSVLSLEFPTYKVFFFFSLGAERVPSQPAQPEKYILHVMHANVRF